MKRISCLLSLNTKASVLWQQCESRLARSDEVVIKLTTGYSCAEWCELAFFVFFTGPKHHSRSQGTHGPQISSISCRFVL